MDIDVRLLATAAVVTPSKMSLAEIKAKIAKAQLSKNEKDAVGIRAEIKSLEELLKQTGAKEDACLAQIKQYKKELDDYETTLAETKINREELRAIGENPEQILSLLEADISKLNGSLEKSQTDLKMLAKTKAEYERRIDDLAEGLAQTDSRGGKSLPASAAHCRLLAPAMGGQQQYFTADIRQKVDACRLEIKTLFSETERLPTKLAAFANDRNMRALLVLHASAQAKVFEFDRFHEANEAEVVVVRCIMGALRRTAGQFGVGYIESLSPNQRPSNFANWIEFLADAKKQLVNYVNPKPQQARPQTFGVVRPAPLSEAAIPQNIRPVPPPVQPVQKEPETPRAPPTPKKKDEEPESTKDALLRAIRESGVLNKTRGKRVAVLAGASGKNAELARFIKKAFELQDLRWYDNNGPRLVESIKTGGIDLLIAFPKWFEKFAEYVECAKKFGVARLIIFSQNRGLICAEIAKNFGTELKLP